jgi:hypothetical protein
MVFWRMLARSRIKSPVGWRKFGVSRPGFVALLWISLFALLASAIGAEIGGPCRPVTYERTAMSFANSTCGITRQSFSGNNRTESLMGLLKIFHGEMVQLPGN